VVSFASKTSDKAEGEDEETDGVIKSDEESGKSQRGRNEERGRGHTQRL
jgi:hypothetical protein